MLFPVFARARESARKTQCLANVKNIAMAHQIYLTDFDAFAPIESRAEVLTYWTDQGDDVSPGCCPAPTRSNPYLRIPVILDEYVKSREVWTCPSARLQVNMLNGMPINPCTPDWFTAMKDAGGCRVGGGSDTWPPGWGGAVTDTNVQGCAYGAGAFQQNYGWPWGARGVKMGKLTDPSKYVVVADAGFGVEANCATEFAYPDLNKVDQVASGCGGHGSGYDYGAPGCDCCNTYVTTCSQPSLEAGGDGRFNLDASYRKTFARHMGGENMGFADGHAKWMNSETILFGGHDHSTFGMHPQVYYGVDVCFNASNHKRDCSKGTVCHDSTAGDY